MQSPRWTLRVPGSTSNLGPGFDLAGLALDLWLDVECELLPDAKHSRLLDVSGEVRELQDATPLFRAFERGAQLAGAKVVPAHGFSMRSDIPLARGLGSSGAAVAAGLLLGAALARSQGCTPPTDLEQQQIDLGSELEGHPDNVVASLRGGCTFAVPTEHGLRVTHTDLHPSLAFVVAWGATPLATERAREALPQTVSFADAVENPRRLVLLMEGLCTGNRERLALAANERLHTPYRLPLIPGGAECLAAARQAGASLATVSGAGSSLFAICGHDRAEAVAAAMRSTLEAHDSPAVARCAAAVMTPPAVQAQP